ncbi:unnamed protein product [Sphagnum jensenii]|uniref:Methyltransferase type 12 domain-containing protein n=1 Tax=Sphagnum jensenii TaxID=128206 RepID=A0ABP0X586_9BRYO
MEETVGKSSTSRLQIYPLPSDTISPYLRDKYEKEARKNWDLFYKRNADRFFKDRHYLDKEWGHYIGGKVEEVGCGVGNTIFPLLAEFPQIFLHACDFSPRAVNLVKAHQEYSEQRVNAFVCDVTAEDLSAFIAPSSVDVVTLVFMLSAVSPAKMAEVIINLKQVLKPGGHVLVRDYAMGDLAQERLTRKDQKISENFFARGDGTRAYYFSEHSLLDLFEGQGFTCKAVTVHCRQIENRSRALVMNRRWIQGEFCLLHSDLKSKHEENGVEAENDIDLSEGVAALFEPNLSLEMKRIEVCKHDILVKCLGKEHQHTVKATGLLLWDAAPALATILEANPALVKGKSVVELGCGALALCSLLASDHASLVVATDGDSDVLDLLRENLELNASTFPVRKVVCSRLEWGCKDAMESVRALSTGNGFDVVLGTDVTYVAEMVPLLFQTARTLISPSSSACQPMLLLCHFARKVAEGDILAAAKAQGFNLHTAWTSELVIPTGLESLGSTHGPLRLLYFHPSA